MERMNEHIHTKHKQACRIHGKKISASDPNQGTAFGAEVKESPQYKSSKSSAPIERKINLSCSPPQP